MDREEPPFPTSQSPAKGKAPSSFPRTRHKRRKPDAARQVSAAPKHMDWVCFSVAVTTHHALACRALCGISWSCTGTLSSGLVPLVWVPCPNSRAASLIATDMLVVMWPPKEAGPRWRMGNPSHTRLSRGGSHPFFSLCQTRRVDSALYELYDLCALVELPSRASSLRSQVPCPLSGRALSIFAAHFSGAASLWPPYWPWPSCLLELVMLS